MEKKSLFSKRLKLGSYSLILCAIVLAAVILLNVIVTSLPTEWTYLDATSSDLSEISDATLSYLRTLEEDITLYHVVSNGNEEAITGNLIRKYAEACPHIHVETVDPTLRPTFLAKYEAEGISENSVIVVNTLPAGERYRIVDNVDMFSYYIEEFGDYFSYEDASYYYQTYGMMGQQLTVTEFYQAESKITTALEYVCSASLPTVYCLSGHGEKAINEAVGRMLDSDNVTVVSDYSLITSGSFPEDAYAVILNMPTKDISAEEAQSLISYIRNDGSVLLVTDYTGRSYEETMPNLMSVAHEMGVKEAFGFVCDENSAYRTTYYNRYYALLPHPATTHGPFSFFDATNQTILLLSSHGIVPVDGYEGPALLMPLLTSSETGYLKVDTSSLTKQDTDPSGVYYLGVSCYLPDEDEDGTVGNFVWYSSMYLQEDYYANQDLFTASIEWMVGRGSSLSIESKKVDNDTMRPLSATERLSWNGIMIFVIPLSVLACGFLIWFKRRRK